MIKAFTELRKYYSVDWELFHYWNSTNANIAFELEVLKRAENLFIQ